MNLSFHKIRQTAHSTINISDEFIVIWKLGYSARLFYLVVTNLISIHVQKINNYVHYKDKYIPFTMKCRLYKCKLNNKIIDILVLRLTTICWMLFVSLLQTAYLCSWFFIQLKWAKQVKLWMGHHKDILAWREYCNKFDSVAIETK